MLTAIGILGALSAIGNAAWAAQGGVTKSAQMCAVDAAFGSVVAAYLIFVGVS